MQGHNSIANQLKSQSLDDVLSSAFKQVGGRVFPDANSLTPLKDLVAIVDAYRATHLVSYGSVIPDTGHAYMVSPTDVNTPVDVVAPANNEVVKINAISVDNADASAIEWHLTLGDTRLVGGSLSGATTAAIPPSELNTSGLILSKGQTLRLTATSGQADALTMHVTAVKTCL